MKNDVQIRELLKKIEVKTEGLGSKPRAAWKTNGIFKQGIKDLLISHTNINTIGNVLDCVELVSTILREQAFRKEAAELLHVSVSELKWCGFSFDDWLYDFKLRASMIVWDDEKKKLNALQKKLKDLRSEDAKTEDALADITKELG